MIYRLLAYVAAFGFIGLLTFVLHRFLLALRVRVIAQTQEKVEELALGIEPERIWLLTLGGTLGGAVAFGLASGFNLLMVAIGGVAGFIAPRLYLRHLERQRMLKLEDQLVDAITLVANSLRSGMSVLQGLEMVTREMGPPIRVEVGFALRENKLGKPLPDAFDALKKRVRSDDLALVVNAMNIAMETGGQLSEVFSRLAESMRERHRIKGRIATLTSQGRLQGIVMTLLPWFMGAAMFVIDREMMKPMLSTLPGQLMLVSVLVLEAVGWVLISRVIAVDI